MSCCYVLDLRLMPAHVSRHSYIYSLLRELGPGERLRVWTPEDPALLMAQIQHQMRHSLVWTSVDDQTGWLITMHIRSADEPLPLADTLRRDHEQMDGRLVQAFTYLGHRDWSAAVGEVASLDAALRAHIVIENELLAPLGGASVAEATAIMRREHDDVLVQLEMIAEVCAASAHNCQELETWLGLLAASLNKHEHREESLLFPRWTRVLALLPARDELLTEVRSRLGEGLREPLSVSEIH